MDAYFFGCWSPDRLGHFLYDQNGCKPPCARNRELPIRADFLDGSLLFNVPDVPGHAVLFHGRGWTFLSFWDRSGDSRPHSNSTFLLRGELTFAEAVTQAQQAFPARWARIQFPVTQYEPPGPPTCSTRCP
jgi:hypothetical protein